MLTFGLPLTTAIPAILSFDVESLPYTQSETVAYCDTLLPQTCQIAILPKQFPINPIEYLTTTGTSVVPLMFNWLLEELYAIEELTQEPDASVQAY